jgi:hypothetical protein
MLTLEVLGALSLIAIGYYALVRAVVWLWEWIDPLGGFDGD